MRKIALLAACAFIALPSTARQADREAGRYVGSRSLAADGIRVEFRADHVVDSMRGTAKVYTSADAGRRTSSGERHDPSAMTAAHATFAIDSMVRVTNVETGRRIVVRVNDRMDRTENAVIRLSETAADRLGIDRIGIRTDGDVRVELLSSRAVPAVVFGSRTAPPSEEPVSALRQVRENAQPAGTVAVKPPARSDEQFTLQIGAFSTLDAARRLAADVEGAWVMQVMEDGERVYRVYFGQYEKEQQARSAQERLKKRGRDSFLRRIPA